MTNTRDIVSEMLSLIDLEYVLNKDRYFGLCFILKCKFEDKYPNKYAEDKHDVVRVLMEMMTGWPEHSGMIDYPVPCIIGDVVFGPKIAYNMFPDKWDRDHPYGQARIRLLKWLKEEYAR
jgi:hypothetical protein